MDTIKKHLFTISGLIFGALTVIVENLFHPWDLLSWKTSRLIDILILPLNVIPKMSKFLLNDWWWNKYGEELLNWKSNMEGVRLHALPPELQPWFKSWWKFDLPVTALYWGLIGFLVGKALRGRRKRLLAGIMMFLIVQVVFVLFTYPFSLF